MIDLIQQYKEALREARKMRERANEEDKKIISGMISDLEYALEWMRTARQPGNRRGIERRAAYQRERPFDPLLMQQFFRSSEEDVYSWDDHKKEYVITDWDRQRIEDALSVLTAREREVYLMSRGYGVLYKDIAKYLGLTESTIKTNIKRAEKKIAQRINESLFCMCS